MIERETEIENDNRDKDSEHGSAVLLLSGLRVGAYSFAGSLFIGEFKT